TIIDAPNVKRETRNRSTQFELGYIPFKGFTSGVRAQVSRNSDVIGIRVQNNIVRDADDFLAFLRWDRKVKGLPINASGSFGSVNNRQPEFSSSGRELDLDASTQSHLPGGLAWNLGGSFKSSDLGSRAPSDTGIVKSDDRSTDRQGQAGVTWAPRTWLNLDLKGSTRRGVLRRPETTFDPITTAAIVLREEVTTSTDNGDLSVTYRTP